jgi:UDP-N-acetyl-D-mannosaminuronate dehydrogenase
MQNLVDARIAIIRHGYVGLPPAVEIGRWYNTVDFDISSSPVGELRASRDKGLELDARGFHPVPGPSEKSRQLSTTSKMYCPKKMWTGDCNE